MCPLDQTQHLLNGLGGPGGQGPSQANGDQSGGWVVVPVMVELEEHPTQDGAGGSAGVQYTIANGILQNMVLVVVAEDFDTPGILVEYTGWIWWFRSRYCQE